MSGPRILLVDGYNVIHRVPELTAALDAGLRNARNQLALRVSRWSREHPGIECVIVFDGDIERAGAREERPAGIRCVFSLTPHGGDDELIRFVREHRARTSEIIVVSDDNKVANNCRAHGAVIRPSDFLMARKASPPRPRTGGSRDGKNLDRRSAEEIDRELRKKWG
jgi:predicted RNA-binding protein with PIN domain